MMMMVMTIHLRPAYTHVYNIVRHTSHIGVKSRKPEVADRSEFVFLCSLIPRYCIAAIIIIIVIIPQSTQFSQNKHVTFTYGRTRTIIIIINGCHTTRTNRAPRYNLHALSIIIITVVPRSRHF